jgi:hypothetical protein
MGPWSYGIALQAGSPWLRAEQILRHSEGITMTTSVRTLGRLLLVLATSALAAPPAPASAAGYDGSTPLLCAINTVMECDSSGECHRHTAAQHPDFPSFLRVNVGQRLITDGQQGARKTEIKSVSQIDGRLILHGGENGRGWAAAIAHDTGRISAGVVADDFTFALFGACTTP